MIKESTQNINNTSSIGILYKIRNTVFVLNNQYTIKSILKILKMWAYRCLFNWDFPLMNIRASLVAQMVRNPPTMQEAWIWSLGQEDPLEKRMLPIPLLPGESHGQRSLVGYSPWRHEQSDMTERLTLSLFSNENYYVSQLHFSSGLYDRYKPWHMKLGNWTHWQRRKENVTRRCYLGKHTISFVHLTHYVNTNKSQLCTLSFLRNYCRNPYIS